MVCCCKVVFHGLMGYREEEIGNKKRLPLQGGGRSRRSRGRVKRIAYFHHCGVLKYVAMIGNFNNEGSDDFSQRHLIEGLEVIVCMGTMLHNINTHHFIFFTDPKANGHVDHFEENKSCAE